MWKKILLGVGAFVVLVITLVLLLTSSITDVANKQMEALRKGDLVTAYSYTSKDFQGYTSLADFKKFFDKFPSLKNNKKASWSERKVENNTGILKGSLTSNDGAVTPIEFHFVRENSEWKIIGIQLQPTGAQVSPSQGTGDVSFGEIYQVLVSDAQNRSGSVDAAKTVIPSKAPKVFVTVYVLHAKAGVKVTAEMVRMENGAKIGPSEATITQSGNVMRDFSFTNAASLWPVGDYKINITTSNNQSASVNFKIGATQEKSFQSKKHRRHR
ncbi:MAG: hypothetical protein A2X78_01045 [Gammaproteobacteria bacterium GWE2_37_16]|nr:MAG: hypothetical protein A2X78_01045 [Gammaproteobacteria bacterium GWE2_37_16]